MSRVPLTGLLLVGAVCMAAAETPGEDPKNILAAQLRDQGYDCAQPESLDL